MVKGRREEEEVEEQPVLCLRIPDDDLEENHQIQKEEEEEREEPLVLCLRIPDEDDDFNEANHQQIQKEETTFIKKGTKRKRRQHECDVCEKVFRYPSGLARHKRTHTNERQYDAMCARSVLVILVI